MAKKIFYFSLSFLVLVLIFLGAYNLVFKNNVNNPIADPLKKLEKAAETPLTAQGSAENPLNESVLGVTMGEDGLIYYYSIDDASLKKATTEGKNKTILMSNLPGTASRVLWSAKKDKALLLLKQMSGGQLWYSANLGNKTLVPLKGEISRLAWDNLGEKIFYQYTDPQTKKRTLNSASADGSNWKKLTDLGTNDYYLAAVPQSSLLSFWKRPSAIDASTFETVSTSGESRRTITSGLFGADYLWSPNGQFAIISGSDSKSGSVELRLIGNDGSVKNLAIPTILSKITWSRDSNALFYALPGALPQGSVLPNDYYEKPLYSKDTFWKIDIATGKKSRLVELKENMQALDSSDLFLSAKEDALYFTDRVSKRLYRIEF